MKKELAYASFILATACSPTVGQRSTIQSRQAPAIPIPVVQSPPLAVAIQMQPQIKREKGITRYPYGDAQVTIRCPILRVCDVELQAGETIMQVLLGDAKRWHAVQSSHGNKNALTPHVGVKPTEKGISTNLVVYTDKRLYLIELAEGGKGERVGFLYPDEKQPKVQRVEVSPHAVEIERYSMSGNAPWRPVRVWDDNTRVMIELAPDVRTSELPVLFITTNGRDELVNFVVKENIIVVGKLFERAALVSSGREKQERVIIQREY